MNTVFENIKSRRSTRSFKEQQISDEDLNLILEAGTYAPTGMNKQTWKFTAIQNREKIQALAKVIREALGRDESYNMYNPPTIILLSNDKENSNGLADCSCALQNIFLMANSLGIGSCWINQLKTICDEAEVRKLLAEFEIPENHIVWGIAALGYANMAPRERVLKDTVIKIIK